MRRRRAAYFSDVMRFDLLQIESFVLHRKKRKERKTGAAYRIRTYDPIITNDVLYQLS